MAEMTTGAGGMLLYGGRPLSAPLEPVRFDISDIERAINMIPAQPEVRDAMFKLLRYVRAVELLASASVVRRP